jgi:glycerophosphoryl diester phosphodiesterase
MMPEKATVFTLAAMLAAHVACGATAENGITAHRGDSIRLPQNSLRAFSSANRIGADWIETDVHLTKDGQLVISHNATTGEYCSQNKVIK